jgi:hypothetical protein
MRYWVGAMLVSVLLLSLQCSAAPFFLETFDSDVFASGRWVKSTDAKYAEQALMIKAPRDSVDAGVQIVQENRHICFGSAFPEPLEISSGDLVVQVRLT